MSDDDSIRRPRARCPLGFWHLISYGPVWTFAQAAARTLFSLRIDGTPPPREGSYVVAANHASYADPVLLQMAVPQPIRYMMTADFYDLPGLQWFFRWMRTLRVGDANGNLGPIREAKRALDAGDVLGIFPEGRLSDDGSIGEFQDGAATLAKLTRAPVLPVRIVGAFDVIHRGQLVPRVRPVALRRGEMLPPPRGGRSSVRAFTLHLRDVIRNLA